MPGYVDANGDPIPAEALDAPDHQVRPLTKEQQDSVKARVEELRKKLQP